MPSTKEVEMVSWDVTNQLICILADKIRASQFSPDVVVAIARGGYVPARLLCDQLDIYNLTSIRISHYMAGSEKTETARLSLPLNIDIKDMDVLLVDDVDDTGDTLQLAIDHLQSLHPAMVKTAVLHHKRVSTIVPEFYAQEIVRWRWITYPWAIIEDLRGFIDRMDPKPVSPDAARQQLVQEFNLNIPLQIMQDVFKR